MNDLIFIKENFNVVSASFMSYGQIQPKLYDWYLPFQDLDRIRLHTKALITVNGRKKRYSLRAFLITQRQICCINLSP